MADQSITQPPSALLRSPSTAPDARTVLAEVRSDASIPFDPAAAPNFLRMANVAFGALVVWRADVSWVQAQEIQLWLVGSPAGGIAGTREEALMDFFESLQTGTPPEDFLEYVGTYLTAGLSHASYALVLGMRTPVQRNDYQTAFVKGLDALLASIGPGGWYAEMVQFLKLMLGQPSSREDFLALANNIGDLTGNSPTTGQPLYPLIKLLVT